MADPRTLTPREHETLVQSNAELQAAIAVYVSAHPEITELVQTFVSAAAEQRVPAAELLAFAQQHFQPR